jgi:hypothetical protein
MLRIGSCKCCLRPARLQSGVCPRCTESFGPRLVGLILRARTDLPFARECLQRMTVPARLLFADACRFSAAERVTLGLVPGLRKCAGTRRLFAVELGATGRR